MARAIVSATFTNSAVRSVRIEQWRRPPAKSRVLSPASPVRPDAPLPRRTLVNVNFPAVPLEKVNGIRVVRQGFHDYSRGSVVEGRLVRRATARDIARIKTIAAAPSTDEETRVHRAHLRSLIAAFERR